MGSKSGNDHLTVKLKNKVKDRLPFSVDTPSSTITIAKADNGGSSHYYRTADAQVLQDMCPTPYGPTVMLPDSSSIQATHKGILLLSQSLSTVSKTAHIVDGITNLLLISLGQLCVV